MKNIFVKLSLVLMLITMSVGQVWGGTGIYLRGINGSWDAQASLEFEATGTSNLYTKTLTLASYSEFKIADAGWSDGCNYGAGTTPVIGTSLNLTPKGSNISVTNLTGGQTYVFTLDLRSSTKTLLIAQPTTYDITVYAGSHGSVKVGSTTVSSGNNQTLKVGADQIAIVATPASGYSFAGWEKTGDVTINTPANASTHMTATGTGTVTATWSVSVPTPSMVTDGSMIIKSKVQAKAAYMWGSSTYCDNLTLYKNSSMGHQYVSAYENSKKNKNAIFFNATVTPGTGWPGDTYNGKKITGDISVSGTAPTIFFYKSDAASASSSAGNGNWSAFTHIGATLTLSETTVIPNTTVKLLYSGLTGTLNDAANNTWNFYYTKDGGSKKRIASADRKYPTSGSSAPAFTPSEVGTYVVYAYLTDPYGLETVLLNTCTLTVSSAQNFDASIEAQPTHGGITLDGGTSTISVAQGSTYNVVVTPAPHYYVSDITKNSTSDIENFSESNGIYSKTATMGAANEEWAADMTPTWSVRGEFNSWTAGNYIEHFDGNTGYVDIELTAGTYEFKVYHHGYTYQYGNNGKMTRNNCTGWTMENPAGKANCQIDADIDGTYRFTFDVDTKKLTVTYPCKPSGWTIDFDYDAVTDMPMVDNGDDTFSLTFYISNDNATFKVSDGCTTYTIDSTKNVHSKDLSGTLVESTYIMGYDGGRMKFVTATIDGDNNFTLGDATPEDIQASLSAKIENPVREAGNSAIHFQYIVANVPAGLKDVKIAIYPLTANDVNRKGTAFVTDLPLGTTEWTSPAQTFVAGQTYYYCLSLYENGSARVNSSVLTITVNGQGTITYDANGATSGSVPEPQVYNEGSDVTLATNTGDLARSGYAFIGWSLTQDGSDNNYTAGQTVSGFTGDQILYARWAEVKVYVVGRFQSKHDGTVVTTYSGDANWNLEATTIPFTYNEGVGVYELSTNLSAKTLSDKLKNINPYFMLRTRIGSEWVKYYFNNEAAAELNASKTSITLANQSGNPSSYHERLRFNDTRNEGTVKMTFNIETGVLSFEIEGATEHNITKEALTNGDLSFSRATASEGVGYTVTATPEAGYYLSAITKNGEGQTVPGRNPDGTYTINATMGDADETWAATFEAITATPHVNSDAAIVQTGATATVTLTYTPVEPKGELTFCYSLYKNNAGAWDKVEDIEFTAATLPSVTFTAPMEEGTYRVGVVMHQGVTCEGAAVGEEQYSSEFRIANAYTVTYGQYPSAKATLTAEVDGESIGDSPAEVSTGSDIVFTVSGIASKYAVQGWYADAECTRPIYDGVAVDLKSYTLSDLSENATVYVKFFAPTVVNGIDLKDETNTSTMSFAVGEKITAIPQFEYTGIGDKAYCWEVLDATTNMHVNATIKSIGDKKVTIYINEPGSYKLNLTIHDADCNGDQNSTYTTGTFTVAEREYYIVDSKFWNTANVGSLTPETTNSDNILLYFRPTLESGEYYFGPMRFSWDYRYFRIYDKAKQRFYVGSNGGNWLLRANQEMPMVVANSDKNINVVDNENNLVLNDHDYYLYIKDGKLIAKTDAPDLSPKVRLAITYTDAAGVHNLYSNEVSMPEESENSAIISFFVPQGTGFSDISYQMEQQKAGEGWVTTGIALAGDPSATESGVYYTTFTQTTAADTHTITLGELTKYVGDYYVRSAAFNSMDNYLENNECKMIFTDRSNGDRFDYFACKWCTDANQDVRYCIANIYNPNLSGVLVADEYITAAGKLDNKAANVRFAWKSATNYMFRAYLEGSTTDDYLKIMPDPAAAEYHKIYKTAGGSTVLSNTKFTDLQDWTYTIAEVYAQLGSKVTVRAKYDDKYQYFYGAGDIGTGAITGYDYLIGNAESPEESTRYKMRIVYDFKVDRLVCGWIPTEDTPIDGDKTIDCDILIIREHNEDANVIRFSDAGTSNPYNIEKVKTVYGVMQLNKSVMTDPTSYSQYTVNQMYWVSFPFDVRVGAIFGISGYGTNWRMMKYNGERRSKEGFFVETTTFWEAMTEDEVMKANTGYLLNLSFPYFANPNSTVWAHGVQSVSLYFPSSESVDIISTKTRDIEVPAHICTIDRTFTKDEVEYNHKETDSNWNIIGIPSFEPLAGNEKLTNENFYVWEVIDGAQTYTPQKGTDPDFNFKPTMAYMVQFGGTLNWKAGSTPVIPSPFAAPARTQENTNYTLDLRLLDSEEKMLDRTYVKLEDEASDEFVLNEDMLKIDNPKYNFFARTADGYATGASNISFTDQTIELSGSVAKEQEYTIRLNRSVNCDVRLIDREEGTTTNLNIMDYTTTIPAGSLGKRFALRIQTSQDVVTGFENTTIDKDDIKKFMIDGILYIQHNGTVYDAMGRRQY